MVWVHYNLSAKYERYRLLLPDTEICGYDNDKKLIEDWKKLQTSDHMYYMCTKWFEDGDVHKYFNPYETPYDAFINFMNILNDLIIRIEKINKAPVEGKNIEEFRLKGEQK